MFKHYKIKVAISINIIVEMKIVSNAGEESKAIQINFIHFKVKENMNK